MSIIYKMQAINRDLSTVNFNAKSTIQTMQRQAADLEDFARKYFALRGDATYEQELENVRHDFSTEVSQLRSKARESVNRIRSTNSPESGTNSGNTGSGKGADRSRC